MTRICKSCLKDKHIDLFRSDKYNVCKECIRDKMSKEREKVNGEKNKNSKLTEKEVFKIRELYKTKKYTQAKIAKKFSVTQICIHNIVCENTWKHLLPKEI